MATLDQHEDFDDFIGQVGESRGLLPAIIRKDYWVTRVLHALADEVNLRGRIVFKGGTSLSKGWGIIERFSEDIDLLICDSERAEHDSRRRREERLCQVRDVIEAATGLVRAQSEDDYFRNDYHLRVRYALPGASPNEQPNPLTEGLLVDAGFRGGRWPTVSRPLNSLLGAFLGGQPEETQDRLRDYADDFRPFEMTLLDPTRTFAEKLLAIHTNYLSGRSEERVRDYYDVAMLYQRHEEVREVAGTEELREILGRVNDLSREFFAAGVDLEEYPLAGSEAFDPPEERLGRLTRAYEAEEGLYYGGQPPFDEIMATVRRIGDAI